MKHNLNFLIILILFSFNSYSQSFIIYNDEDFPEFIHGNGITDLTEDKDGNIWVASYDYGIGKYDGTTFTVYQETDGILSNSVYDIKADSSNNIWIATYDGLAKMNTDAVTLAVYDSSNCLIPGRSITAVDFSPEGTLWISSKNGSSNHQPPVTFDGTNWELIDNLPTNAEGDEIFGYAFINDIVWMASDAGVLKYESGDYTAYYKSSTGLWSARCIEKDNSENIWFTGPWAVLNRTNDTWNCIEYVDIDSNMENTSAKSMKIQGNYIWIGAYDGLYKYDPSTETAIHWDETNSNLPDHWIYDIIIDKNDNLWMATVDGLVKMSMESSISEDKLFDLVKVYPTPCLNELTISLPEKTQKINIEILDINGKIVLTKKVVTSNSLQINTSTLNTGTYILKLEIGSSRIIKKIEKN